MIRLRRFRDASAAAFLAAVCVACQATRPALVAGAGAVDVAKGDPPRGAKNLGPIEVASGEGCGLHGTQGSYEAAEAELRNTTEDRGGDYVKITKVVEPHVEGACYDERFVIRGVVFRVNPSPAPASTATAEQACVPACLSGYACEAGTCRAECNPACAPDQTCGQDRACRAAARP